ncbi:hypothetical protein [Lacticaseibacillus hulanensis]|uniref:hypothetical protein n=1 Tax=Lacticaseibacillus hulanensis TaxID=2493111 RepID=UPI000FD75FD4|nr:hypothetical protein [Lacticaseibacillus hulanensis]
MRIRKSTVKYVLLVLALIASVCAIVVAKNDGSGAAEVKPIPINDNFTGTPTEGKSSWEMVNSDTFSLPFAGVTTSALTQVDSNTQVIDPNATLTFRIAKQSQPLKLTSTRYVPGEFGLVLSLGNSKYIDGQTRSEDGTSDVMTYSSDADGKYPIAKDSRGYLAIGSNDWSAMSVDVDQSNWPTTYKLTANKDIFVHVNLSKLPEATRNAVTQITVQEQFSEKTDGTKFYKVILGKLGFKVQLHPQVESSIILPKPITYKGQSISAIVIGSGTMAGDQLHYATQGEPATLASRYMDNADGTRVTVNSAKKWAWLVPSSVNLGQAGKLSVIEERRAVDTSDTADKDIADNSQYIEAGGGRI